MELLERSTQIDALHAALASAGAGDGRVVLLSGDAGLGKTALIRQFIADTGVRVLAGAADDLLTPIPLGPIIELSRQGGGSFETAMAEGASRDDAYTMLMEELERHPHPVLVAIDDVHWADDATLDVLSLVARRIEQLPVLLMLAFRPSEIGPDHHLHRLIAHVASAAVQKLHLPPLSRAAVAQIVSEARAEAVFHATQGNPFFLTALVDAEEGEIPATVSAAVLGRVGRLRPAAQKLTQLVATAPGGLEGGVLDELDPRWTEHATEAERQGLLIFESGLLRFQHELGRRAVVESLTTIEERKLHVDIIRGLQAIDGAPARLVHHAVSADDRETLFRYAGQAATSAAQAGAHHEAVDYLRRYLQFADRLDEEARTDGYDMLAVESWAANLPAVSSEAAGAALALHQASGDAEGAARSLQRAARAAWFSGDADLAVAQLDEALQLVDGSEYVAEAARCLGYRALVGGTAFGPADIEPWATRALELVDQADDAAAAQILDNVGTVRVRYGLDDGSILDRALELAKRSASHVDVVRIHANRAALALEQRDLATAGFNLDRAESHADEHHILAFAGYLHTLRAQRLLLSGAWAEAEAAADWVVSTPRDVGFARIPATIVLTKLEIRRGSPEAGTLVDGLWEAAAATDEAQRMVPAAAAAAEFAWLTGKPEVAADKVTAAIGRAVDTNLPWVVGELVSWAHRAGVPVPGELGVSAVHALQLAGASQDAAAEWERLGIPFARAMALADSDTEGGLVAGLATLDELGATGTAARLRSRMRELGLTRIPKGRRASSKANPAGLTNRQVDVLLLVAEGLTNAEIAERLFVSVRTVDHHVSAILMRLDVPTRREAGRMARELGLATE